MISYELALQLKEAGFPQTGERPWYCGGHIWYEDEEEKGTHLECPEKEIQSGEDRYCGSAQLTAEFAIEVPTLSELIEACGDKFDNLSLRHVNSSYDNHAKWGAYASANEHEEDNIGYGSTPEEAVAKLWLELNKK